MSSASSTWSSPRRSPRRSPKPTFARRCRSRAASASSPTCAATWMTPGVAIDTGVDGVDVLFATSSRDARGVARP